MQHFRAEIECIWVAGKSQPSNDLILDTRTIKQINLVNKGFILVIKRIRKREFLNVMNLVIPWSELLMLKLYTHLLARKACLLIPHR